MILGNTIFRELILNTMTEAVAKAETMAGDSTSAATSVSTAVTGIAQEWNNLSDFLTVSSAIACVILLSGMIYFALKYKRKTKNDKTPYISHNSFLEFLWSFIPLVIFLFIFVWGWRLYHEMRAMPANALEVHVFGEQWLWKFEYKNGKKSTNEMVVPVNQVVKLIMTSVDGSKSAVIHSFFVPTFRIKQDVVPGRYTTLWFKAEKLGEFHVFCAEYCGDAHSTMAAKIRVVSQIDFEEWLAGEGAGAVVQSPGLKLYNEMGCIACHSTDGSKKVGPSFKGLFGREEEMTDGQKITADENYLRESVLMANAKVVKGYSPGVMPIFQGKINDEDVMRLIDYIKEQK